MRETKLKGLAHGRTLLFVPAQRPDRFAKAASCGADVMILDLEDSVPAAEKSAARAAIEREWAWLRTVAIPLVIRINSIGSEEGQKDLNWIDGALCPAAVMVPKVESAADLALCREHLRDVALLPLIESAGGYSNLQSVAGAPGVVRLAIGHIDFMSDIGIQDDRLQAELAPLRFAVAVATRLNRLAPPIDGVTVELDDPTRLREDVMRALRFGFGGKLCIHPRQVEVIHQAMLPSERELDWARKVLSVSAAAGGAAVQVDGRMVDLPVVLQAHRILSRAAQLPVTS